MNNKRKYVHEKAAAELSGLKEWSFRLTKNTASGKPLPKHHSQMQNQEKAVSVEASAVTGAQHRQPLHRRQQSDSRRMAARLQSITAAHFPASGTRGDIWHTHLPSRKQAAVAARCLTATEPEVSKNLMQNNHHNCWLINMRTKQWTKNWFVTVSKGSPRDAGSASHPACPWLCAEHQNSRPDHSDVLMEKLMRVREWTSEIYGVQLWPAHIIYLGILLLKEKNKANNNNKKPLCQSKIQTPKKITLHLSKTCIVLFRYWTPWSVWLKASKA